MPALPHLANAVTSGILSGTVYGLMALGLSAIFGVIRLVNFAHGELMTLAMYAAVVAFQGFALDPFLTMIAAAAVVVVVPPMMIPPGACPLTKERLAGKLTAV